MKFFSFSRHAVRVCAALAVMAASNVFFSSCGSSGTNPITVTIPAAPTQLAALSADDVTVRLIWKASTSEASLLTTSNPGAYRITVTGGTSTTTVNVAKKATLGDSTYVIDVGGLRAGTVYTFAVQARTADTVSAAASIMWSPALRLRGRVYESASQFASGIGFQGGTVQSRPIGNATEAAQADFAIATPSDSVYFGTPRSLYNITNGRGTLVDTTGFYRGVDSLNQVYEGVLNPNVYRTGFYRVKALNPAGLPKSLVLYTRTADGNFAKIFLRAVGGSLLQGNAPNRYVDLEISYQPTANAGYTLLTKPSPEGSIQSAGASPLWERAPFVSTPQNLKVSAAQK
jgi:hypothetical protein